MRRRLLPFVTILSLCLCLVIVAIIWHTTRHWHYFANYTTYINDANFGFRHDGTCRIKLVDGQLSAVRRYDDRMWLFAEQASNASRGWSWGRRPARAFPGMSAGSGIWFKRDVAGWQFELPLWVLAIGTAALPAQFVLRRLPLRGRQPGLCPNCGYDLRATPHRCPECGKAAYEPLHNLPMQRTATA